MFVKDFGKLFKNLKVESGCNDLTALEPFPSVAYQEASAQPDIENFVEGTFTDVLGAAQKDLNKLQIRRYDHQLVQGPGFNCGTILAELLDHDIDNIWKRTQIQTFFQKLIYLWTWKWKFPRPSILDNIPFKQQLLIFFSSR